MRGLVVKVVLAVTRWRWVRWMFTQTRPGRRVSLRFVAGETLEQAIAVARAENGAGRTVSLNLLGEHVHDAATADRSFRDYLAAIEALREAGIDGNISVKPTQLGLGFDDALCEKYVGELAARAGAVGTTVTIDMEDSSLTERTLGIYERTQREHGNLGVALQAYLRRTPDDLERIRPLGGHVRLCKGAYDEPEAVAFRTRPDVDAAFDRLATTLLDDPGVLPALATHDDARIEAAVVAAADRDAAYEFQMLYGIRTALQEQVTARGLALRSYVPYGEAWYPYLTRRIAERPANVWFFFRALVGR